MEKLDIFRPILMPYELEKYPKKTLNGEKLCCKVNFALENCYFFILNSIVKFLGVFQCKGIYLKGVKLW